ncbi:hypothetical protein K7395_24705 [Streptomyces filamentosus]|uniref:Uncharacterized protein n=3 Tax=Streptomyces TaxID=1883 RepID=A0ABY4UZE9_STRFL|nr:MULTISPECIES: hypothetical protein [Streptomyces]ESU46501.1 hypothetical protein P376_5522 [Streptomyces sp. HCCB10043]MYR78706.1 hypothetical protein [Streptomyces sp. SID5466]USC49690.1 hypothetical protein K7395_24705 [Streptomyces filamentosus]
MSKPNKARFRLSAVKASYAEAVGGELVEVETDDGKTYTFPHPLFTDDQRNKELEAAEGDSGKARVLLGDQWDAYMKSGGDANGLMLVYMAVRAESQDTMGKHRPPRR